MSDVFITAFVTFFVIIDPPGVAPMFYALTQGAPNAWRRIMAVKAVVVAGLILVGFGYGGEWLLTKMGVSLDAFRAAGGALLFLMALDMLFELRSKRRDERAEAIRDESPDIAHEDISVFPMAIPMIAGPGAITSVMLFMSDARGDVARQAEIFGAIGATLFICFVIFFFIGAVMKLIGKTAATAITRIFGVILAALAMQLLFDGLKNTFGLG